MKLQFSASEVAELLCQALSHQIALGQITGAVVTCEGATVYVNEEPIFEEDEVEEEVTEEVTETSAAPKKRRGRRSKAQKAAALAAAAQEVLATTEAEPVDDNQLDLPLVEETIDEHLDEVNPEEPVVEEEPLTVAEVDAADPFEDTPVVDTSTDVFADDDEDPFA